MSQTATRFSFTDCPSQQHVCEHRYSRLPRDAEADLRSFGRRSRRYDERRPQMVAVIVDT
jgi:hypothetical protein